MLVDSPVAHAPTIIISSGIFEDQCTQADELIYGMVRDSLGLNQENRLENIRYLFHREISENRSPLFDLNANENTSEPIYQAIGSDKPKEEVILALLQNLLEHIQDYFFEVRIILVVDALATAKPPKYKNINQALLSVFKNLKSRLRDKNIRIFWVYLSNDEQRIFYGWDKTQEEHNKNISQYSESAYVRVKKDGLAYDYWDDPKCFNPEEFSVDILVYGIILSTIHGMHQISLSDLLREGKESLRLLSLENFSESDLILPRPDKIARWSLVVLQDKRNEIKQKINFIKAEWFCYWLRNAKPKNMEEKKYKIDSAKKFIESWTERKNVQEDGIISKSQKQYLQSCQKIGQIVEGIVDDIHIPTSFFQDWPDKIVDTIEEKLYRNLVGKSKEEFKKIEMGLLHSSSESGKATGDIKNWIAEVEDCFWDAGLVFCENEIDKRIAILKLKKNKLRDVEQRLIEELRQNFSSNFSAKDSDEAWKKNLFHHWNNAILAVEGKPLFSAIQNLFIPVVFILSVLFAPWLNAFGNSIQLPAPQGLFSGGLSGFGSALLYWSLVFCKESCSTPWVFLTSILFFSLFLYLFISAEKKRSKDAVDKYFGKHGLIRTYLFHIARRKGEYLFSERKNLEGLIQRMVSSKIARYERKIKVFEREIIQTRRGLQWLERQFQSDLCESKLDTESFSSSIYIPNLRDSWSIQKERDSMVLHHLLPPKRIKERLRTTRFERPARMWNPFFAPHDESALKNYILYPPRFLEYTDQNFDQASVNVHMVLEQDDTLNENSFSIPMEQNNVSFTKDEYLLADNDFLDSINRINRSKEFSWSRFKRVSTKQKTRIIFIRVVKRNSWIGDEQ